MIYREQLRRIAAYQHGIVTTLDADEHDIPTVELRKLAQRGAIRRIGHGVYRFDEFPRTASAADAEAVAIVGEGAYLEGESVLALLGLGHANPAQTEVATTRQIRRALPRWIKTTRRTTLKEEDTTSYDGVPCVRVKQALLQTQSKIPRARWAEAIRQAERRDLISIHEANKLLSLQTEEVS